MHFPRKYCYRWVSFQDQMLHSQLLNHFPDKIVSELQKTLHCIRPEYVGMLKQALVKWMYVYSSAEMVLICFPNTRNYLFDNWHIAYLLCFHVKLFYFSLCLVFSLCWLLILWVMCTAFASWKSEEMQRKNWYKNTWGIWLSWRLLELIQLVDRWIYREVDALICSCRNSRPKFVFHETLGSWVTPNCGVETCSERANGAFE